MAPVVIVGSGLAGYTLARELRKLDSETPLTLIAADSGDFYSKPTLSNALAQGKSAAQLVVTPAAAMASQLALTLLPYTRVESVDAATHTLHTVDMAAHAASLTAGQVNYSQLVLALGADPVRLPLAGDGVEDVFSVNDLDDYARFRSALDGKRTVTIIGAGLIGCEFANDLAASGHAVTVIDPAAYPLSALLPEPAGRGMMAPLERAGVSWLPGRTVLAVHRVSNGYRLALSDGSELVTEIVLSAVGLRPRVSLAQQAGLVVKRGIVVDANLRSSNPEVFALGDCAEIEGRVMPYVAPIMHAARALAQTLSGKPTPVVFPAMPVAVKTPACPVVVLPVDKGAPGAWQLMGEGSGLKMLFNDDRGKTTGFVLMGEKTSERVAMTRLVSEQP